MASTMSKEEHMATEQRMLNRRVMGDRRSKKKTDEFAGDDRRAAPARRKVERRRLIDPTTCERDYSLDEVEFMKAMDEYKRKSGRQFPTWSEVLEVVRGLGYMKPEQASGIPAPHSMGMN
jgi:hypothetical protein